MLTDEKKFDIPIMPDQKVDLMAEAEREKTQQPNILPLTPPQHTIHGRRHLEAFFRLIHNEIVNLDKAEDEALGNLPPKVIENRQIYREHYEVIAHLLGKSDSLIPYIGLLSYNPRFISAEDLQKYITHQGRPSDEEKKESIVAEQMLKMKNQQQTTV